MKIQIIGIEKPFELKVKSKSGALFSISEKKEITIQFITKVKEDIYYKGMINPNITIIIQKGFKTDLTTVPQIFWSIFPPIGTKHEQYGTPAILHDYLYSNKIFDRKTCDLVFLQAMKQEKCNLFTRYLFYFAVRIFGGKHY
jgi:hypothetical protein